MGRVGLVLALLAAVAAAGEEIPFPVRKSTTASKDGATYVVTGRMVIRKGVHVTFKHKTRIVGRGDDPTLVVEGSLTIEGQPRQEVLVDNLRIEPAAQFQGIRLEWARMNARFAVAEGVAASGKFSLEQCYVRDDVDLTFKAGEIRMLSSEFRGAVALKCPTGGKTKVRLIENHGRDDESELARGFWRGLAITGFPDVLVRACWLSRRTCELTDNRLLKFDGNTVVNCDAKLVQTAAGRFGRTKVSKCDFHQGKLILHAPKGAKPDKVVVEQCWFGGVKRPKEIFGETLIDGRNDEECGVQAILRKVNTRPLGLGGKPVK